ncbi:6,7-dimethyl-8-ribityllumazine synthase [Fodinicurvata sp. EGI_FJ10296]|uniref:6,7-dimethyl-8-ribityllumazine synthase n=1 Tax=Fodinicurvata sp. EGI_FJ10296 TaxID=3231908 RepID=UPI0034545BBD
MTATSTTILIVEGRFYTDIADALMAGATTVLDHSGATYERIAVPGALEIPAAIAFAHDAARQGRLLPGFDGFVALGCVIRGETTHYDYVCGESARGLQDLAVREKLAVANGILTCEDHAQAWTRASVDQKNKGGAVARACLDMIALRRHFGL